LAAVPSGDFRFFTAHAVNHHRVGSKPLDLSTVDHWTRHGTADFLDRQPAEGAEMESFMLSHRLDPDG